MNTTKTVLFACALPGCRHEQKYAENISYYPECPFCGTKMFEVIEDVADLRKQLDDLMGYTAEDIKNEI